MSFSYPQNLHPVVAPPETLQGLGGWVSRVSLEDNGENGHHFPILTVDVFICDDPKLDPRVPCVDEDWHRGVCDRFEKFKLGNAVAFQCVSHGSAACSWEAIILRDGGSVKIHAQASDHEANATAHDRATCADAVVAGRTKSPLREILASLEVSWSGPKKVP